MTETERAEYFEFLRFRSVGTDPACLKDTVACAVWLKGKFKEIGFSASLLLPEGVSNPPCVYAERIVDEDAPTVLVYGHYDVQPPDPLEEWVSDPFEPEEREGRVYCRGAQDDKGQLFAFFCGMREFLSARPQARLNIKVIVEGQEECGGDVIYRVAESQARRLKADVLLVADTNALPGLRPALVAGLRGLVAFTVVLEGAARDLHSGIYGGLAPNAAQAMVELLSSLHSPDGSVAVEGFTDGMEKPAPKELELAADSSPTEEEFVSDTGTKPCGGQRGRSMVERNSFLPTIEINGISSGYAGPGSKTVIPCRAVAKISMRLVPGQSPRGAYEAVKKHLEGNVPEGMRLSLENAAGFAEGFKLPLETPLFRLAEDVLGNMGLGKPGFLWEGASIPCVSMLSRVSGASPLLVGWGQSDDAIHSPNESFSIKQFDVAAKYARLVLDALAMEN